MTENLRTNTSAATAATVPAMAQDSGKANWYPSSYGATDEIGAANLLTPEVTLAAVKLVKTGAAA